MIVFLLHFKRVFGFEKKYELNWTLKAYDFCQFAIRKTNYTS